MNDRHRMPNHSILPTMPALRTSLQVRERTPASKKVSPTGALYKQDLIPDVGRPEVHPSVRNARADLSARLESATGRFGAYPDRTCTCLNNTSFRTHRDSNIDTTAYHWGHACTIMAKQCRRIVESGAKRHRLGRPGDPAAGTRIYSVKIRLCRRLTPFAAAPRC
jgi:hypothetical protein